jgi:hypothetical protein
MFSIFFCLSLAFFCFVTRPQILYKKKILEKSLKKNTNLKESLLTGEMFFHFFTQSPPFIPPLGIWFLCFGIIFLIKLICRV